MKTAIAFWSTERMHKIFSFLSCIMLSWSIKHSLGNLPLIIVAVSLRNHHMTINTWIEPHFYDNTGLGAWDCFSNFCLSVLKCFLHDMQSIIDENNIWFCGLRCDIIFQIKRGPDCLAPAGISTGGSKRAGYLRKFYLRETSLILPLGGEDGRPLALVAGPHISLRFLNRP